MHIPLRSLSSLLLLTSALALQSCAGLGMKQSLDPQRKEVSEMRQELTSEWESIGSALDAVEAELVAFGNHRISTDQVDAVVVREAIELPETTDAEGVREAQDEVEARMASYEDALDGLDEQSRAEIESVRTSGARLWQQLHVELPASLTAFSQRTVGMTAELTAIEATADQIEPIAQQNPLMTSNDMAELETDKAALKSEVEGLRSLAHKMATDSTGYAERLSAATTRFGLQLSALGQ